MNLIGESGTSSSARLFDVSKFEHALQKNVSVRKTHTSFVICRQLRRQLSEITIDPELDDSFVNGSNRVFELEEDDEYFLGTYTSPTDVTYIPASCNGTTTIIDLKNISPQTIGTKRTYSTSSRRSSIVLSSITCLFGDTEVKDATPPKLPVRVKSNVDFESLLKISNYDTNSVATTES
jgi:hypothetical protein